MSTMDATKRKLLVLTAVGAICQQVMLANTMACIAVETESNKMRKLDNNDFELTMANLWRKNKNPQMPLVIRPLIHELFFDPGRNYFENETRLKDWEFYALVQHLAPFIHLPRCTTEDQLQDIGVNNIAQSSKPCKLDVYNRLFLALHWLETGENFRSEEIRTGWAKTCCCDDLKHVLKAIIRGLANEVEWPDAAERQQLAAQSAGIFKGCIGLLDCTEHTVERPKKDKTLERLRYSGKKKAHTIKTIAVIDRRGYFRYVATNIDGNHNDRDAFTSCPLYLRRGQYFDEGQFVGSDGGFAGDGPVRYSSNAPMGDPVEEIYSIAFKRYVCR